MAGLRVLKKQAAVAVTKRYECQDMKPEIENCRDGLHPVFAKLLVFRSASFSRAVEFGPNSEDGTAVLQAGNP